MITGIKAMGHMVLITSDVRGQELVSRRESILRLQALLGMDGSSRMADMLETMVKACNEARINEFGTGYRHETITGLLKQIRAGQLEAQNRDRAITDSSGRPMAGAERTTFHEDGTRSTQGVTEPPPEPPTEEAADEATPSSD